MVSAALTMRKAASWAGPGEPAASGAYHGADGVSSLDPLAFEAALGGPVAIVRPGDAVGFGAPGRGVSRRTGEASVSSASPGALTC
jgi:hypothetical protein